MRDSTVTSMSAFSEDAADFEVSIFPVFAVNVPMPPDTAVPGSFGRSPLPADLTPA